MSPIKKFYNQYVMREDRLFVGLLILTALIGLAYVVGNQLTFQFADTGFLDWQWLIQIPVFLGLGIVALYARKLSPRMSFLTWTYSLYFFMVIVVSLLTVGIQTTPFPPIDHHLVYADRLLGFHQLAVLNWTYAHKVIHNIFNFCYSMIGVELGLFPMILALLLEKRAVKVYLMALLIVSIIGFSIYYFFPTTAPASVFFDKNFLPSQHDTFIKFFEIHHHLPITTTQGGMIAFPSFHVIWATLLAYSFKNRKYLFYPIVAFNAIIIASTVFLGWHYLTDVIGGLLLSALSIWAAEMIYKRYLAAERKQASNKRHAIRRLKWNIQLVPNAAPVVRAEHTNKVSSYH